MWNCASQPAYTTYADTCRPRGVLALPEGPVPVPLLALHALTPEAAADLLPLVPSGPAIVFMTEEWPLALVEARASRFHADRAWLLRLRPDDFVDRQNHRIERIPVDDAGTIARIWQPDWPAEPYVRSRIRSGPSACIQEDGRLVAWGLTHVVTEHVGIIGIVHVLDAFRRRGYAASLVSALVKELLGTRRVPACHIYLGNDPSFALFKGLGFGRVKRQAFVEALMP